MSQPASVRVSIDVALDPKAAFAVFTEEIDTWYRRGPHTLSGKAVGVRFEPGVGGRLVEVTFAAEGGGTRVTLEHRGLERLAPQAAVENARHGWRLLIPWYLDHVTEQKQQT